MRDSYTNPSEMKRIESFEIFGLTNWIHVTGIWKKFIRIQITIRVICNWVYETNYTIRIFKVRIRESGFANPPAWIRKDSFRAIVLRIRQDSWGFVGFVKTARIFGSSGHETNPRFESLRIGLTNPDSRICEVRIRDYNTKQIFLESGFVTMIRYESMDSQNESMFLRIPYTIPAFLIKKIKVNKQLTNKLNVKAKMNLIFPFGNAGRGTKVNTTSSIKKFQTCFGYITT